jgi:hypothetical protein
MVARATRLDARVGGTTPDDNVRFPDKFSITVGAFALDQVLNFESLVYVVDCYGELHPLHEAMPVGSEPPVSPSLPGLLGADLEILA